MAAEQYLYPNLAELVAQESINGLPLRSYVDEIKQLYQDDKRPWVIGYSGGKDSTVIVELVYQALLELSPEQRHKPVYVVSSDTLVETPVVVNLIKETLQALNAQAARDELPLTAHQVTPRVDKTFWVNLIGKGYPAPTNMFRWCTENMKINPVSDFIEDKVSKFGEVIVVLGARKEESSTRAQVIARHRIEGSRLNRHTTLANAFVYTPIEDWTADDVWGFLLQAPTPWNTSNRPLFDLYKGSNQGECPLVIDKSTPSCGNSRFGCWTCTVVTTDRAMESLIQNGEDWMQRLSDFRNKLARTNDPEQRQKLRNYKRRTGKVTFYSADKITDDSTTETSVVHGPYWLKVRQDLLRELLTIEKGLRGTPNEMDLITEPELHQIRQEWLNDPNEPDWRDSLPAIYREVYGRDLQWVENDAGAFTQPDAELLEELAVKYDTSAALVMKLLDLELSMDGLSKRVGLFNKMTTILKQDWDELDEILANRPERASESFQELVKEKVDFEGKKQKHRSIYDEVSDRLTREWEHLNKLQADLEETF